MTLFKLFSMKGRVSRKTIHSLLKEEALIIDVRSAGEFSSGHVLKAVNIPHTIITKELQKRSVSKDKPIIIYCASGMRASMAVKSLKSEGYTHIYNAGTLAYIKRVMP